MKSLILLALLLTAVLLAEQDVRIHGREITHDGSITKVRGDATISHSAVRIQADSINYNRDTGEAEATGNVRIKFLSKPASGSELPPAGLSFEERIKRLQPRFPPEIMAPR